MDEMNGIHQKLRKNRKAKKIINKFPEIRWSFFCVFSELRKDFALVKGEILNKRPMATETNQLHKYIIFK